MGGLGPEFVNRHVETVGGIGNIFKRTAEGSIELFGPIDAEGATTFDAAAGEGGELLEVVVAAAGVGETTGSAAEFSGDDDEVGEEDADAIVEDLAKGVEIVAGGGVGALDIVVMIPVANVDLDEAGALVGGEDLLGNEAGVVAVVGAVGGGVGEAFSIVPLAAL